MSRGHVPLRRCLGCSRRFPKRSLLRFTLGPAGLVTGDGPGRGYYVCRNIDCLGKALTGRNLSRLFGRPFTEEEAMRLKDAMCEEI